MKLENCELFDNVGKTYNERLLDEVSKSYFEKKNKIFPDSQNPTNALSIVSVLNENEIKSQGMSCVNDLLNDNWGKMLTNLLSGNSAIWNGTVTSGATKDFRSAGNNTNITRTFGVNGGSLVQIGSGVSAATRSDFAIQTPFTNGGVEDSLKATQNSSYTVGLSQIKVPTFIAPTAGGGTIRETVLVNRWSSATAAQEDLLTSRDNISPFVNFSLGDTITIDYLIQL